MISQKIICYETFQITMIDFSLLLPLQSFSRKVFTDVRFRKCFAEIWDHLSFILCKWENISASGGSQRSLERDLCQDCGLGTLLMFVQGEVVGCVVQGSDFAPSGDNYTTYCLPWRTATQQRSTSSRRRFSCITSDRYIQSTTHKCYYHILHWRALFHCEQPFVEWATEQ